MYGRDSMSSIECLQHFVQTCNDYASTCILNNQTRCALELLLTCEQMLISGLVGNYPAYKFQTFNNLAHAHNVQGNVRISLKYLMRALEYAMLQKSPTGQPVVDTYVNIANASCFLGNY